MIKATIYKTEEIGGCIEDGGKWTAVCELHSTLVQGETKKELQNILTEEFCSCCQGNCMTHNYSNECNGCGATHE